jgi:glycosyltransferase involved in cell wall biosynthesis
LIAEPDPDALAASMATLAADRALARRLGGAGFERASLITWDGVVERLVG